MFGDVQFQSCGSKKMKFVLRWQVVCTLEVNVAK